VFHLPRIARKDAVGVGFKEWERMMMTLSSIYYLHRHMIRFYSLPIRGKYTDYEALKFQNLAEHLKVFRLSTCCKLRNSNDLMISFHLYHLVSIVKSLS